MSDGPPSRRLWLVRHGETTGQSSIRFHGSNDVPLSDHGRAQIRALIPRLRDVPFVRVVHSPLQRAAESARILAEGLALPMGLLRSEERLREISFGACEGMTETEIAATFPQFWGDYKAGRVDTFPDGEPRSAFVLRVQAAVRELAQAAGGDVLVVSHRGTVRQALRALLAIPPGQPDAFGVELGSVSTVRDDDDGGGGRWRLEALGLLP